MIMASHSFNRRSLNVLDENGNEGCATCGRPRSVHPIVFVSSAAGERGADLLDWRRPEILG